MENREIREINQENGLNIQDSRVEETINELSEILSSEGQQEFSERNERVKNLLSQLEKEVHRIREEIDYDYSDYEARITQSDEYIEKVKNRLLEEEVELSEIREELVYMFEGMEEVMEKFFRKYLEDLIYERMIGELKEHIYKPEVRTKTIQELSDCLDYCKQSGFKGLDLKRRLNKTFLRNPERFIEWSKKAGENGVKSVDLKGNNLYEIFSDDIDKFIEWIREVGESGIKKLDLRENNLNKIFSDNPERLIEWIEKAGECGIKSLDLTGNELNELYPDDPFGFIEFVVRAGKSGIKSLQLMRNNVGEICYNNPEEFIEGIKRIGKNGIKYLNLEGNDLNRTIFCNLNQKQKSEFEELKKKINIEI